MPLDKHFEMLSRDKQIRLMHKWGMSQAELAREHKIHKTTVWGIVRRRKDSVRYKRKMKLYEDFFWQWGGRHYDGKEANR